MQASEQVTERERVTACDLCGDAGQRPFRTVNGLPVVRCAGCGLLYARERFSDEALGQLYSETYYQERGMVVEDPDAEHRANLERLAWLPGPPGRLLDVGCGDGSFLAEARKAGWEVEGTEVSEWGVRRARERFGLEVALAGVEDLSGKRWPLAGFDAVTCWHNIEHQRHPMRVLEAMRDLLKPGGRMVLRTPNADSFDRWWHGDAWAGWQDPGHFYFFGLRHLLDCARRLGLRVLHVDRGTTRALDRARAFLKGPRRPASSSEKAALSGPPAPHLGGPSGRPGLKRAALRLAGYLLSGRDVTLLLQRPAGEAR